MDLEKYYNSSVKKTGKINFLLIERKNIINTINAFKKTRIPNILGAGKLLGFIELIISVIFLYYLLLMMVGL